MPTHPLLTDEQFLHATALVTEAETLALATAAKHYPQGKVLRIRKGKGIVDAVIREPLLSPTRPLEIRLKVFNPATQKEYNINLDQIENN